LPDEAPAAVQIEPAAQPPAFHSIANTMDGCFMTRIQQQNTGGNQFIMIQPVPVA